MSLSPEIVYEDSEFIVVNKPAGLITHQKNIEDKQPSVVDWVILNYPEQKNIGEPFIASGTKVPRAGIVHRLDKETSGLLLIAKSDKSFYYFKDLFQTKRIKKHYLALIHGKPKEPKGTISSPLGRIGLKRTTKIIGQKLANPTGLNRLFLHAYKLEFATPSNNALCIEADLPEELQNVLNMLD